jgi:hypothetical protein
MASDSVEKSSGGPRTFWGYAAVVAVGVSGSLPTLAAGAVNGAISAASGRGFEAGFEKPMDVFGGVMEKAAKWSDENGDFLTKTTIGAAVTLATRSVGNHHKNSGGGN